MKRVYWTASQAQEVLAEASSRFRVADERPLSLLNILLGLSPAEKGPMMGGPGEQTGESGGPPSLLLLSNLIYSAENKLQ